MSKETRLCLLHSVTALGLGLLLYVFLRQNTYLHTLLETVFRLDIPIPQYSASHLQFVANWLGDFLWAYALCFALYRLLSPFPRRLLLAALAVIVLGAVLECLQKLKILSGTFDPLDIFTESVAAGLAAIIIKRRLLL